MKKALDAGETVLLPISAQLPWGFELFAYTDTVSVQVYIHSSLINHLSVRAKVHLNSIKIY